MTGGLRRLTFDTVVYGLGGSASRIITLLFVPIFTRIFTTADYGALDLLATILSILTLFAMAGLNSAVYFHYRRLQRPEERSRMVGSAMAVAMTAATVIAVIGVVTAEPIAGALLTDRDYTAAVALNFVWLPVNIGAAMALDLLRLEFRPMAFSLIGLGRNVLAGVVGVVLVVFGGLGIEAILMAHIGLGLAGMAVALWLTRGTWTPALDLPMTRSMLRFGLPLVPAGLAYWVMNFSDRFFLIQFRDLPDVGVYAIANRMAALPQIVILAFSSAWFPFAHARAQEPGHAQVFARVFGAFSITMLVGVAGLALFAREILLVVTTPAFVAAFPYVGMLGLALVINGSYQIVSVAVQLSERTWHMAWTSGIAAAVNIGLNFALIPPFGLLGAAVSTLVSYAISTALLFTVAQRVHPIPYDVWRPAVVGLLGAAVVAAGVAVDLRQQGTEWSPLIGLGKLVALAALAAVAYRLLETPLHRMLAELLGAGRSRPA